MQRKKHLFLYDCFVQWGQEDVTVAHGVKKRGRTRDVAEVEQLEETVNSVAHVEADEGSRLDVEAVAVQLGGEPLHFGTVSAGFFGDNYVRARSVTGDGGEPAHHAFSPAQHWKLQRGI